MKYDTSAPQQRFVRIAWCGNDGFLERNARFNNWVPNARALHFGIDALRCCYGPAEMQTSQTSKFRLRSCDTWIEVEPKPIRNQWSSCCWLELYSLINRQPWMKQNEPLVIKLFLNINHHWSTINQPCWTHSNSAVPSWKLLSKQELCFSLLSAAGKSPWRLRRFKHVRTWKFENKKQGWYVFLFTFEWLKKNKTNAQLSEKNCEYREKQWHAGHFSVWQWQTMNANHVCMDTNWVVSLTVKNSNYLTKKIENDFPLIENNHYWLNSHYSDYNTFSWE